MKSILLLASALLLTACSSLPAADDKPADAGQIEVLSVGGGSSHDFARWFDKEDSATLSQLKNVSVRYTDKPAELAPGLKTATVLYLTSNQTMSEPGLREGVFAFARAGKGLLLVHPALWYNWKDWPEYNRELVGGGASSHDKLGEFEVTVVAPQHPLMKGVPATFSLTDELYHFRADEAGSAMEVLATGKSPTTGKVFPVAWITKHPTAKIVCLTLGHDGRAHQHAAYKTILQNSVQWVAKARDAAATAPKR